MPVVSKEIFGDDGLQFSYIPDALPAAQPVTHIHNTYKYTQYNQSIYTVIL